MSNPYLFSLRQNREMIASSIFLRINWKEKQMDPQAENTQSKERAHVSSELTARGYFEAFCISKDDMWEHPVDRQIRIPLSKGTVAFTSLETKREGDAYMVFCDFGAQKIHFISTITSSIYLGVGIIPFALITVNHVYRTIPIQDFAKAVPHYCGKPVKPSASTRNKGFFSLLNSR